MTEPTYTLTYQTFPIDERAAAAALGIDYDELIEDRRIAQEERDGKHGPERQEVRAALDDLRRETTRQMFGL